MDVYEEIFIWDFENDFDFFLKPRVFDYIQGFVLTFTLFLWLILL